MARSSGPIRSVSNPDILSLTSSTTLNNGFICQSGLLGSNSNPPTDALAIVGTANAAAANVLTITNASMGQATTLTINDPGVAAANLVTSTTSASQVVVTLTAAQVIAAYATPVVLVAAPGAGKVIRVKNAAVTMNYVAAFTGGGVGIIQYGTSANGGGTDAASNTISATLLTSSANGTVLAAGNTNQVLVSVSNKAICWSNQTAVFAGGTGSTLTIVLDIDVITSSA